MDQMSESEGCGFGANEMFAVDFHAPQAFRDRFHTEIEEAFGIRPIFSVGFRGSYRDYFAPRDKQLVLAWLRREGADFQVVSNCQLDSAQTWLASATLH